MEKVRPGPWCGQPSDRGRLRNRTDSGIAIATTLTCKRWIQICWQIYIDWPIQPIVVTFVWLLALSSGQCKWLMFTSLHTYDFEMFKCLLADRGIKGSAYPTGCVSVCVYAIASITTEKAGGRRKRPNLGLFMVALCNRVDHIHFHPVSSSSFFLFFPRLISAVGDWMSTILRHMVWS